MVKSDRLLEMVEAMVAYATRSLERLNDQQRADIEKLRQELGTTHGILHGVAAILREHLKEGDIPFERLTQELINMVRQREALITQQSTLPPDPDVMFARIQKEIDAALADSDDERARQFLIQKRDAKLAASEKRKEAVEGLLTAATRDRLDAAASEAALGDLACARLEYLVAAGHFKAAIDMLPPSVADARWGYLIRYADVLDDLGNEKGDNAALLKAIDIYRFALLEKPRERMPLDWATTQNNLGNALQSLGERESGTVRIEEALEVVTGV
jgi:tetratricopeptide (TPR) repeat protein